MATKVAIYIRVSSEEQEASNQLPPLEDMAARRGFKVVEVYSEAETAYRQGHQVELARLIEDARKGKFSVLLLWSLDRLSREGPAAMLGVIDRLRDYRVKVISYQEAWTEAPGELGELLYAITGWVANMESKRRSERTIAGLERARLEGKPIGKRGKDKCKRKRTGYLLRYAQKKVRQ